MRSQPILFSNSLSGVRCEKKFFNMQVSLWVTQLASGDTNLMREIRVTVLTHKNRNEYFYLEYGKLMFSQAYGINSSGIIQSCLVLWHKNTFHMNDMLAITFHVDFGRLLITSDIDLLHTTVNNM